jgi:CO/xanthine dehydrogenase FAD-binding subunit
MILEYHRPRTMEDALALLSRAEPPTLPLGGGTVLNRGASGDFAVVDLQALNLCGTQLEGNRLTIGACATLEVLTGLGYLPQAFKSAVLQETNMHIRQMGTLAGSLAAATGRSSLTAVCLAMDARLVWEPGNVEVSLGDWLSLRPEKPGLLITAISLPANVKVAYEAVSRTPADWPLVCAAAARWPSGRARLVVGGFGSAPLMVMDGTGTEGAPEAARSAYSQAGDEWASAEYRSEMGAVLAERCIRQVEAA